MTLKISSRGRSVSAALLFGLAGVCVSAAARADDLQVPLLNFNAPASTPQWIVTVEAMGGIAPRYPGASSYSFYGLPGFELRREDQPPRFSSPDDSFSFVVLHNDWFAVGPAGNWVGDRPVKNNPALFGMNSVDASIELGAFAEWTPLSFLRVRAEARKAVSGYDGWAFALNGDIWQKWGPVTLSIGPRLNFNNDQYATAFFSVNPWQAVVNQSIGGLLTPYNATGGLTSAGFTVAARYELSETWRLSAYGNYEVLTGSVANSPLVLHTGSRDQFSAGIEIAYRFRTGALAFLPTF
jgi:MipA family protein